MYTKTLLWPYSYTLTVWPTGSYNYSLSHPLTLRSLVFFFQAKVYYDSAYCFMNFPHGLFIGFFYSSPRLRNVQSYKLLGFLGDFAFTWPHHFSLQLERQSTTGRDSWHLEETDDHWKRLLTAGRVSWQLEETAWIDDEYFNDGTDHWQLWKDSNPLSWLLDKKKNQWNGLEPRVLGVVREQRPNPATKLSPRLTVTFNPNGEPSGCLLYTSDAADE